MHKRWGYCAPPIVQHAILSCSVQTLYMCLQCKIGLIFPCLSSHHQCTRVKHTAQLHYFVGGSRSRQEVQPSDVESVNGSSRESKTSRRRESQIPTCRRCIISQCGSCLLSFQCEVIFFITVLLFVDCNVAKVKKTPQSPHETHCNNQ